MNVERLVAMVNDIAAFFAGEAGPAAPAAVANHLRRFWEPRMRSQIIAAYKTDPSSLRNLSETGRAAIAELSNHEGHEVTKDK
jgi:formate dehydrogenase subunit delta